MAPYRVWAPLANRVSVNVAGGRIPLEPDSNIEGWWQSTGRAAQAGEEYTFNVDDAENLPDPRSGWQPQGVHKASKIVDHGEFRWTDDEFQARPLSSSLVYELHVGTFTPEGLSSPPSTGSTTSRSWASRTSS